MYFDLLDLLCFFVDEVVVAFIGYKFILVELVTLHVIEPLESILFLSVSLLLLGDRSHLRVDESVSEG